MREIKKQKQTKLRGNQRKQKQCREERNTSKKL
jgi:hypothetical protein